MSAIGLSASAALLTVFALAAGAKVRSASAFDEFAGALGQFGVPVRWRRRVGILIVVAEALVMVCLVLPIGPAAGRLLPGVVALVGFSIAIGRAGRRHPVLACHCFGAGGRTQVGPHLAVNTALILLGLAGVAPGSAATSAGSQVLAVGCGLIGGAMAVAAIPVLEAIGPSSMRRAVAPPERL